MRLIRRTCLAAALLALASPITRPATAQETSKKTAEELTRTLRQIEKLNTDVMEKKLVTTPIVVDSTTVRGRLVSIPDLPPEDPHHSVMLRLKATMNQSCATCHGAGMSLHRDDLFGLSVTPADPTIRDQLKLENRGLVVTAVAPQTTAEAAGIKDKDILIASESKALTTVDDLKAAIRGSAHKPLVLKLLRAGEPLEIAVKEVVHDPQLLARLDLAVKSLRHSDPSYWIGVSVNPADETLRSHLKLKDGAGLVVAEVIKETPAEKAGLKVNDVLLAIDGHPVKETNDLVQAVQLAKQSPMKIALKRRGGEQFISVTPVQRENLYSNLIAKPEQTDTKFDTQVFRLVQPGQPVVQYDWNALPRTDQTVQWTFPQGLMVVPPPEQKGAVERLDAEIKDLSVQLKELKEAIKTLNATMKDKKAQDR